VIPSANTICISYVVERMIGDLINVSLSRPSVRDIVVYEIMT